MSQIRTKGDQQNVPQAWAEVLGAGDDWAELLRLYSFVVGLPKQILTELDGINASLYPDELARRWKGPITQALAVDFARGVQLHHVKNKFGGEALAYLEMSDDVLHRHRRGPRLAEGDLERIRAKIDDLQADLDADPEVEPELRDFLVRHVQDMARALREVPIRGADGIREAFERSVADVHVLRVELVERAGPKRRELLIGLLGAAGAVLGFGSGLLSLEQARQSASVDDDRVQRERRIPHQARRAISGPQPTLADKSTARASHD